MPRVQVVRALSRVERPLSAYGIHEEILSSGGRIDVVSVYRILATLVDIGLAHHVGLADGYVACRFTDTHPGGTEHVVCKDCDKVVELPLPASIHDEIKRQLDELGYELITTKVEVLATCESKPAGKSKKG